MSITKSCNLARPPKTSHNFAATTQVHPRPAIVSLPPPTTTRNQPQFCFHHPRPPATYYYFTTATHDLKFYWKMNSFKFIFQRIWIFNKEMYFYLQINRLIPSEAASERCPLNWAVLKVSNIKRNNLKF